MNFISFEFIIFFIVLLVAIKMTSGKKKHHIILLIASYIFYAVGDIRFLVILIGISIFMWYLGKYIQKNRDTSKARRGLIAGVFVCLLVLGIFKYFNFFLAGFCHLFKINQSALNILLPLGISFYIFQSISYIADVYMKKTDAEDSLINVLLYIGFFPQIISGPIVKAADFLPQLKVEHSITQECLSWGIQKFFLGVFKKTVIANRLGFAVDAVYSAPAAYSGLSLLVTVLTYSLQIYYDFSGYSDMAIGVAHVFGFDLGKNFNLPYLARNPSAFWERWHISLSSWFKSYVYIPLGGNRKGEARTYLNIFITMFLSGVWHGAGWTFILWGILHAFASILHKSYSNIKKELKISCPYRKISGFLAIIVNFLTVSFLWIPFRIADGQKALLIIKRIFKWSKGIHYIYDYSIIFISILIIIEVVAVFKNHESDIWKPLDLGQWWCKVLFSLFLLIIVCFSFIGPNEFIYAQF